MLDVSQHYVSIWAIYHNWLQVWWDRLRSLVIKFDQHFMSQVFMKLKYVGHRWITNANMDHIIASYLGPHENKHSMQQEYQVFNNVICHLEFKYIILWKLRLIVKHLVLKARRRSLVWKEHKRTKVVQNKVRERSRSKQHDEEQKPYGNKDNNKSKCFTCWK